MMIERPDLPRLRRSGLATNKLRLELIDDEPYGESARWITVSPRGARTRIVIKKAQHDHEKAIVGRSDGATILLDQDGSPIVIQQ